MPKSQIIIDIVEDSVPLEKSLTRLLVLAKDIKNDKLMNWAEKEIKGYSREDDLPEYRIIKSHHFVYCGLNGCYKVENNHLPEAWLGEGIAEQVASVRNYDGVKYLTELSMSDSIPTVDLSRFAGNVASATNDLVQCTSIHQRIPQSLFQGICSAIKLKMLTALMELEKKYGCLDELGIDISNRNALQIKADNDEINRTIFNISFPQDKSKKVPLSSKIAWNIFVPILTAVAGSVIVAIVLKLFQI